MRTVRSSAVIPNRRCRAWQAAVLPAPFDPMNGVSPGSSGMTVRWFPKHRKFWSTRDSMYMTSPLRVESTPPRDLEHETYRDHAGSRVLNHRGPGSAFDLSAAAGEGRGRLRGGSGRYGAT